jgi:hypothetical protein
LMGSCLFGCLNIEPLVPWGSISTQLLVPIPTCFSLLARMAADLPQLNFAPKARQNSSKTVRALLRLFRELLR